ncbi:hypothetical protein BO78DRAFT_449309 [Aspergillus sclerotiicarbonarius CBS 121057]|uniref:Zn(2)-C6 fungal-type domain-containing protein n=1 Tax=Aspergillus sclerotiicarbonarius (strain CBS 121057 / IBT 28362) TaxID=1448318 RepID=A0A319E3L7_ASPSB|nr:hypothetical protein BO78DRAFT_449309 [Aspergillus sclerotiicarbonarius CBS 121057]
MPPAPETRRSHINRACEGCRLRKVRCTGRQPCKGCQSLSMECVYRAGGARKRRNPAPQDSELAQPASETSKDAGSRPGSVLSNLVQFKQQQALRVGIGVSNPTTGSFQFYGPSSHFCFIQRIYERVKRNSHDVSGTSKKPVPDGIERWGIERFMFSVESSSDRGPSQQVEAYFPKDMGMSFIHAYFAIMHPQMPLLSYPDTVDTWNKLWEPPRPGKCTLKGKELLYTVLAIGARVANARSQQKSEWIDLWAEHFSRRADNHIVMFQEPSLKGTHFMLLKVMRPNEAYLYFGYAARSMMALGINRSQVTDGNNISMHRLRLTFWTIFANEKMSALFIGRPSALCEDQIDTAYPEDLLDSTIDPGSDPYFRPTAECAWVRAMSEIGKIADKVSIGTYSPTSMREISDVTRSEQMLVECDAALKLVVQSLPTYLHFFDENLPIGEGWQEVQRISLGLNYCLTQMLMHRPMLIYATTFTSTAEAEKSTAGLLKIQNSVEASVSAARDLINLAHDVYFRRYPDIRFDGSWATFLASACITLLYDVLDPRTATEHATTAFFTIERGIQCLDEIEHIGPLTGKAISLDIMKVAKDALVSIGQSFEPDQSLVDSFLWLMGDGNINLSAVAIDNPMQPSLIEDLNILGQPTLGTPAVTEMSSSGPGINYMSHWLENGFDSSNIPESLF